MPELDVLLVKLENIAQDVSEIKTQVQKTNGCVGKHETDIAVLKMEIKGHLDNHDTHSATTPANESAPNHNSESIQLSVRNFILILIIISLISVGGSVAASQIVP